MTRDAKPDPPEYRMELPRSGALPAFMEIPAYLWDRASFDSEGDSARPTSGDWTYLSLRPRHQGARVELAADNDRVVIASRDPALVERAALFLQTSGAAGGKVDFPDDWDHDAAMTRRAAIRDMIEDERLAPFDNHAFWGGWKHPGLFSSDFAMPARVVMHGLHTDDPRAVPLAAGWLRDGVARPEQANALRHALAILTGEAFDTDADWTAWYFGSSTDDPAAARHKYPRPDLARWREEVEA